MKACKFMELSPAVLLVLLFPCLSLAIVLRLLVFGDKAIIALEVFHGGCAASICKADEIDRRVALFVNDDNDLFHSASR